MKTLYPELLPFNTFFLDTGSHHAVYVEQSGNPDGLPVVFLHGGPCSGTKPDHRRFFNPERYHIILLDQRGCGLSEPFGALEGNTTPHLIADMEQIRRQLQLEQWLLFGGSWGAALALLYAQHYPQHVAAMILRGVFLARQSDFDWFIQPDGVARVYPELWQALKAAAQPHHDSDLLQGLLAGIFSADVAAQQAVTEAWSAWGGQVALGHEYQAPDAPPEISERQIQQVQMELHYAKHKYFLQENQLLDACDKLKEIPTVILHGQMDLTCPLEAAWRLKQHLPHAQYRVIPQAGHVARGEAMIDALISATDEMADLLTGVAV